ncbi:HEPN domain-containing protein [uncultured Spirosoma sp.]|uniref:HEPN domain-containing protein n=1 Tax=uncultured Spirosoma sp. TaxID=278208 RepID=UPI00258F9996|nr:HEPN domain-containing protein [uncultured Spirosoma sp.]
MIDSIMDTFDKNFGRLNNLLSIFYSIRNSKGRSSVQSLDLLRSTVVLTHSTLEDYLRSLLYWKLPLTINVEKLNKISFYDLGSRSTKAALGDLLIHKDKTIDELIKLSIEDHLSMQSFNESKDVVNALISVNIPITHDIELCLPDLDEMTKRRHNIVHRADKGIKTGSGNFKYEHIGSKQVIKWMANVDSFVNEVNKNFR